VTRRDSQSLCNVLARVSVTFVYVFPDGPGKEVYMDNARLLITNRGRLGLWHNYQSGAETGCCCCTATFVRSHTNIDWYHVSDIAYTQISYARKYRLICWFLAEGAMLRVCFKKFPSMSGSFVVSVPSTMAAAWSSPNPRAVNKIAGTFVRAVVPWCVPRAERLWHFACMRRCLVQMSAVYGLHTVAQCFNIFGAALNVARSCLGFCFGCCKVDFSELFGGLEFFSGMFPGPLDLRMYSTERDACHDQQGSSLRDFLDVQRVVLAQRKTSAVLPHSPSTSPTPTVVLSAEPRSLFPEYHYTMDAPTVTVSLPIFPLTPGEHVLEALPLVRSLHARTHHGSRRSSSLCQPLALPVPARFPPPSSLPHDHPRRCVTLAPRVGRRRWPRRCCR
jgi:hypothetical protein